MSLEDGSWKGEVFKFSRKTVLRERLIRGTTQNAGLAGLHVSIGSEPVPHVCRVSRPRLSRHARRKAGSELTHGLQ